MEIHTKYTEDSIDLFQQPARIIIAGYSNSGKSQMCSNLINNTTINLIQSFIVVLIHMIYKMTQTLKINYTFQVKY